MEIEDILKTPLPIRNTERFKNKMDVNILETPVPKHVDVVFETPTEVRDPLTAISTNERVKRITLEQDDVPFVDYKSGIAKLKRDSGYAAFPFKAYKRQKSHLSSEVSVTDNEDDLLKENDVANEIEFLSDDQDTNIEPLYEIDDLLF